MEIVTLARVHLKRIGSARGAAFTSFKKTTVTEEVSDDSPETLRELVISVAVKHGESRDALAGLGLASHRWREPEKVVFDIQLPMTQFSDPYAYCEVFPALKVGERFFKLEEVNR